jgi:predicted acetyltransferase
MIDKIYQSAIDSKVRLPIEEPEYGFLESNSILSEKSSWDIPIRKFTRKVGVDIKNESMISTFTMPGQVPFMPPKSAQEKYKADKGKKLSTDILNQIYPMPKGLEHDKPMYKEAASERYHNYWEEQMLKEYVAPVEEQRPFLSFFNMMGMEIMDPVNIGSGFIPIVPALRKLGMPVAKGVIGRAGQEFVEGVGQAFPVEVANYYNSQWGGTYYTKEEMALSTLASGGMQAGLSGFTRGFDDALNYVSGNSRENIMEKAQVAILTNAKNTKSYFDFNSTYEGVRELEKKAQAINEEINLNSKNEYHYDGEEGTVHQQLEADVKGLEEELNIKPEEQEAGIDFDPETGEITPKPIKTEEVEKLEVDKEKLLQERESKIAELKEKAFNLGHEITRSVTDHFEGVKELYRDRKYNVVTSEEEAAKLAGESAKKIDDEAGINGFIDPETGDIVIVADVELGLNPQDFTSFLVKNTIHEAVGHYGLRKSMGDKKFQALIDRVKTRHVDEMNALRSLYKDFDDDVLAEELLVYQFQERVIDRNTQAEVRLLLQEIRDKISQGKRDLASDELIAKSLYEAFNDLVTKGEIGVSKFVEPEYTPAEEKIQEKELTPEEVSEELLNIGAEGAAELRASIDKINKLVDTLESQIKRPDTIDQIRRERTANAIEQWAKDSGVEYTKTKRGDQKFINLKFSQLEETPAEKFKDYELNPEDEAYLKYLNEDGSINPSNIEKLNDDLKKIREESVKAQEVSKKVVEQKPKVEAKKAEKKPVEKPKKVAKKKATPKPKEVSDEVKAKRGKKKKSKIFDQKEVDVKSTAKQTELDQESYKNKYQEKFEYKSEDTYEDGSTDISNKEVAKQQKDASFYLDRLYRIANNSITTNADAYNGNVIGFPVYQGNKKSFIEKVGGTLLKWIDDLPEETDTIVDMFGGSGGYGLWMAANTNKFKRLIFNDFEPDRVGKIKQHMMHGSKFLKKGLNGEKLKPLLELIESKNGIKGEFTAIQTLLQHVYEKGANFNKIDVKEGSKNWKNRKHNQNLVEKVLKKEYKFSYEEKMAIRALLDQGDRKGRSTDVIRKTIEKADELHQNYKKFINKGGKVEWRAYDSSKDYHKLIKGNNNFVVMDPPYIMTTAYGRGEVPVDGEMVKVDKWLRENDFYKRTHKIFDYAKSLGNSVLYNNSLPSLSGAVKGESFGQYKADANMETMATRLDDFRSFKRATGNQYDDDYVGISYGREITSGGVEKESSYSGYNWRKDPERRGLGPITEQTARDIGLTESRYPVETEAKDTVSVNVGKSFSLRSLKATADRGRDKFEGADVKLSSIDSAYKKAIDSGDMETAQKIVNEAAKKAGFLPKVLYHGTDNKFTVFDKGGRSNFPEVANNLKDAHFFTDIEGFAKNFGKETMPVYLKMENPIEESMTFSGVENFDATLNRILLEEGVIDKDGKPTGAERDFDSIILYLENENQFGDAPENPALYVVFSPEQIKSAKPITKDNKGNIIPLSVRFNKYSKDIRFSLSKIAKAVERISFKDDKDINPIAMHYDAVTGDTKRVLRKRAKLMTQLKIGEIIRDYSLATVSLDDSTKILTNILYDEIDYESRGTTARHMKKISDEMEDAGVLDYFASGNNDLEIIKAGYGEAADPKAQAAAKILQKYSHNLVREINRHGGFIPVSKTRIIGQAHNIEAIADFFDIKLYEWTAKGKKLNKQAFSELQGKWKARMLEDLDIQKSFYDRGIGDSALYPDHRQDPKILASLDGAFDGIFTGIHTRADSARGEKSFYHANAAERQAASRLYHFKDGETAGKYHSDTRSSSLSDQFFGEIVHLNNIASLVRKFGPAYREVMNDGLIAMVADVASKSGQLKANEKLNKLKRVVNSAFDELEGANATPENYTWSKIIANTKIFINMTKMGNILISSMSDPAFGARAVARLGRGGNDILPALFESFGAAVDAKTDKGKMVLRGVLGDIESMQITMMSSNRFDPDDIGQSSKMARMQTHWFKSTGITGWNKIWRDAASLMVVRRLGEYSQHDMAWLKANAPEVAKDFEILGIKEESWNAIRNFGSKTQDGKTYVTLDSLEGADADAMFPGVKTAQQRLRLKEEAISSLTAFMRFKMDEAVLTPGLREKLSFTFNTREGTWQNSILKMFTMYKSFPLTAFNKVFMKDIKGGSSGVTLLIWTAAFTTVMQYMAMNVLAMLRGESMHPINSGKTWTEAFLRGGAMGLMADFIFGESQQTLSSPALGMIEDVKRLAKQAVDPENEDFAGDVLDKAKNWTPFINHFAAKAVLDRTLWPFLFDLLDHDKLEQQERYLERMGRQKQDGAINLNDYFETFLIDG